jgi:N-acetylmuramoyl-L-alanine amidase
VLLRALILFVLLASPFQALASGYVVRPGDTLALIAQRFHTSMYRLARINGISNLNLVQVGRVLFIPRTTRTYYYRVRWGDTLIGVAASHRMSLATIRSLNPRLGAYLLAGQWLKLCGPCSGGGGVVTSIQPAAPAVSSGSIYVVQPGDTLTAIASHFGVYISDLMTSNHLTNANYVVIGSRLVISRRAVLYGTVGARSLIVSYAQAFGIEAAFPLAIGWQESGFNQNLVSRTGAIGVMQVEPYTGAHISYLLGRSFNLYNTDDNIHAGVYWLAHLVAYYGGNERLAAGAYYQGSRSVARHGFFRDTAQYVNNIMALRARFAG